MMDQMAVKLDVAQTAASKSQNCQNVKGESSKDSQFSKLMDRTQNQAGTEQEESAVPVLGNCNGTKTVDLLLLQQLAAMQMYCAAPQQMVVVSPEAAPEQQAANPLVQQVGDATVAPTVEVPQVKTEAPQQMPVAQTSVNQQVTEETPEIKPAAAPMEEMNLQQEAKSEKAPEVIREKAEMPELDVSKVSVEGTEQSVFKQVETAPVKVSETALEHTAPKSVEHQISETLTKALAKGESRVELQLTPRNLGKITIELTQKHDGTLEVVLHAENSQTRTLLEREVPTMQNLFTRNTQQEVLVEVPRHQEAQQNNSYDGHQQQRQQQEQRQHQKRSEDFLNQMRLGFAPVDDVTV